MQLVTLRSSVKLQIVSVHVDTCDLAPDISEVKEGLAFGTGPKICLGRDMMREIASSVVKSCLGIPTDSSNYKGGVRLEAKAEGIPIGVQAYLGWQQDIEPMIWARDMKQLPTQGLIRL